MKKCCKCRVEKSINAFAKNKNAKDGHEWMCKECRKKRNQTPRVQSQRKQWRKDNAEYMKQYVREHYLQNKPSYHAVASRYQSTPEGKVRARIRGILNYHLKLTNQDKTTSTSVLLGYGGKELKEHLDKQGMDWDKHQIDHKVPITWFKKDTPLDIVHDLRNLQPLTELENKRKKNYYAHPIDKGYYEVIIKWIKEKYVKNLVTQE
jgi:hypothetical protein